MSVPTSADYVIEPGRTTEFPRCACCGEATRISRGFVYRHGVARSVYLVRWVVGVEHDADVAVSVGGWCDADPVPRVFVALKLRQLVNGPAFMVVDADPARWDSTDLLGQPLEAAAVRGQPLATEVYAILDAVSAQDGRVNGWKL